jgi:hypothetical protein
MGIGVTPQGSYVHLSGLPVQTVAELKQVIHDKEELADAIHWLEHRHDFEEEKPKRIVFNPDGSYEFEDGTPINSITELIDAMGQGNPALEAACLWFSKEIERRQKVEAAQNTEIGQMAKEVAQLNEAPSKPATAPPVHRKVAHKRNTKAPAAAEVTV